VGRAINTATAQKPSPREALVACIRDFSVLRETRAEYWGVRLVNLLDCTAYFAMLTIAAVFLSNDLGMSDESAESQACAYTWSASSPNPICI
jgi:hypothetical protein